MITSLGSAAGRVGRWGFGLALLAISAAHTACASSSFSSTEPTERGDYSATVAFATDTLQLSGNAIYSTTQNNVGQIYFVFYLWTGDVNGTIYNVVWFQRENLDVPGPGSYTIADVGGGAIPLDDFFALYAFADAAGAAATFHSVTGTLTIDTSEFQEITGAFELIGAFDEDSYHSGTVGDSVQVNGTFRAEPGTIY
ncbi:MAG: hypothetical protein AMS18_05585 [Gemmatimonas sp. SG8_17]|nr:MAG: hypothetical protein AMS18_05585 [Gemmatimonas sp. SG8_17]